MKMWELHLAAVHLEKVPSHRCLDLQLDGEKRSTGCYDDLEHTQRVTANTPLARTSSIATDHPAIPLTSDASVRRTQLVNTLRSSAPSAQSLHPRRCPIHLTT